MKFLRKLWWRKSLKDLFGELKSGKRREISGQEIELALAYDQKNLPPGLHYPRDGEVYEAINDVEVDYLTSHCAPFTGGGRATLPKGERVRVNTAGVRIVRIPNPTNPISVYCDPLNYDELHEKIVSLSEREEPRYTGYYLSIATVDLNRSFRLVSEADRTKSNESGR